MDDKRGRRAATNKTCIAVVTDVKKHIESFPTMDSHYRRKSTKRKYLDPNLSIAKMHALYTEDCKSQNKQCISQITYRRIFVRTTTLLYLNLRRTSALHVKIT